MTPVPQPALDRIIKVLEERGALKPCPRCGKEEFTLADLYSKQNLQEDLKGLVVGGPTIPCAVVICQHCGFISYHALGYLELLDDVNKLRED